MHPGNSNIISGYKKICLLLFLFEWISLSALAYNADQPDKILIVLNKSFYVSGETIWYKVYILNKSSETKVVHVGLFNSSGKLLTDQKLQIIDGTAHRSIEIPIEWNDDVYRLEVITRWNLNFDGLGIFEMKIPIYNSSLHLNYLSTNYHVMSSSDFPDSIKQTFPFLKLDFDKKIYNPGDSVSLKILTSKVGSHYDLAVSVLDFSQIPTDETTENKFAVSSSDQVNPKLSFPIIYQHEMDLSLVGAILKTDKSSVINSNQLSIYLSSQHKFLRAKAVNGNFSTDLPDINGQEIIQVLDMNPFQEQMPYIRQIPIWDHISFGQLSDGPPVHTPAIDQYIYHIRLRRKIDEIFIRNKDYTYQTTPALIDFPKPDMTFDMSKFKLLADLDDFISSVMVSARRYINDGNHTFRLLNDQTNYFFMYHPWYLVDGLFTYDENEILKTPFESLKSVGFYTNYKSIYHFEPLMILNGIVKVTTKDQYWEKQILSYPNTFVYQGYYKGKSFKELQPELNADSVDVPDLRPVVYWDPVVMVTRGQETRIKFKSTDNTGIFLVKISGVDENDSVVNVTTVYKVEQSR